MFTREQHQPTVIISKPWTGGARVGKRTLGGARRMIYEPVDLLAALLGGGPNAAKVVTRSRVRVIGFARGRLRRMR